MTETLSGDAIMSSRIARVIIRMVVAAGIGPFGIGSAAAQPSGIRSAAQDCLANRYESPASETDTRHAAWRERREAGPATGLLAIASCRTSLAPQASPSF
jgi:hypothetical protein